MPIGLCPLCLRDGQELRNSHLLPAWSYRPLRDGNRAPRMITEEKTHSTSRQIREHRLCTDCEQRFGRDEDVVARLVKETPDGSTAWLDALRPIHEEAHHNLFDSSAVDVAAVTRFASSVFWRSAVFKTVDGIRLGPYGETFRRYLVGESGFPSDAWLMVSVLRKTTGELRTDRTITTPATGGRIHRQRNHWFALLGTVFNLGVGNMPPPGALELCFSRTGRVVLGENAELIPMLAGMAERHIRKRSA